MELTEAGLYVNFVGIDAGGKSTLVQGMVKPLTKLTGRPPAVTDEFVKYAGPQEDMEGRFAHFVEQNRITAKGFAKAREDFNVLRVRGFPCTVADHAVALEQNAQNQYVVERFLENGNLTLPQGSKIAQVYELMYGAVKQNAPTHTFLLTASEEDVGARLEKRAQEKGEPLTLLETKVSRIVVVDKVYHRILATSKFGPYSITNTSDLSKEETVGQAMVDIAQYI